MDKNESLDVVERYNPNTDTWKEMAPLSSPKRCLAAAVLNGRIYVVGGSGNISIGRPQGSMSYLLPIKRGAEGRQTTVFSKICIYIGNVTISIKSTTGLVVYFRMVCIKSGTKVT